MGKEPYNETEHEVIEQEAELDNKVDKETEAEKTANSSISPELPKTARAENNSEVGVRCSQCVRKPPETLDL